jgi:hypothetical protein
MMLKLLPAAACVLVVIVSGLWQGLHAGRWGASNDLQTAVSRLGAIPITMGEWQGTEQQMDTAELKRAGIDGWVLRRYRNVRTNEAATVMVVCGRPGPISVHTPDVCYAGSGYQAVAKPARREIPVDAAHSQPVWAARFKSPSAVAASQLDVYWVFHAGEGWVTPDNPRWTFARSGALYKLYVVADVPMATSKKREPCADFLQACLPAIDQAFRAPPTP